MLSDRNLKYNFPKRGVWQHYSQLIGHQHPKQSSLSNTNTHNSAKPHFCGQKCTRSCINTAIVKPQSKIKLTEELLLEKCTKNKGGGWGELGADQLMGLPHLLLPRRFTCTKHEETVYQTEWLRSFRWFELRKVNTSFHAHYFTEVLPFGVVFSLHKWTRTTTSVQPHAATSSVAIWWLCAPTKAHHRAIFKTF